MIAADVLREGTAAPPGSLLAALRAEVNRDYIQRKIREHGWTEVIEKQAMIQGKQCA